MMISEAYSEDVFIADFTDYTGKTDSGRVPFKGVVVGTKENGIIPSFVLHDEHKFPFKVVNNEHNPAVFKRSDGSMVSQCECIIYSDRNDNRRGWMFFLELKYCEAKNLYSNMLKGIGQLKATCNFIFKEKQEYDSALFKKYLVISTPGVEPLDPFDASYFSQDDILTLKEDTGAILRATNEVFIQTPAVLKFCTKDNNA